MSDTSKLVGRQLEFGQISNFLMMGPSLIISGVKGVGKTYLVRQWLAQKAKNFKWYNLGNHLNLREVLGVEEKNIELALEDAANEWRNFDIVVWDNFQYLAPSARSLLLSFIYNSGDETKHIFIGDENFLPLMPLEASVIRLSPLNEIELKAYLEFLGIANIEHDINEIRRKTSALPLFINLLLQNRDMAQVFDQFKISTLPKEAQRIIKFLAILGRSVETADLLLALELNSDRGIAIIAELKNQYMIDEVPGCEGKIALSSFVAQMCMSAIKTKDRLEMGRVILQHLIKSNSSDRTLLLVHALKCEEYELAENLLKTYKIDEWQQYLPLSLDEIRDHLEKKVNPKDIQAVNINLSRALLQIYFITAQREKGVILGESLLKFFESRDLLSGIDQEIVVDVIRQQNRCHEFNQAYNNACQFLARVKDPYQSHLYIEMAVSLLNKEPKRAAELLERVINRDISGTSFMMLDKLAQAHAHFQLARYFDDEKSSLKAQEHYEKALQQYDKLGQPYFSQVSRLNLLWIRVNEKHWLGFDSEFDLCYEICERYGYSYVLAGLHLLKSIELSDHLQFQESLERVEQSLTLLPKKANRQALLDVLCQKARVLNLMGKRKLARDVLGQISDIISAEPSIALKRKRDSIELELNAYMMSTNDLFEAIENQNLEINSEVGLQEILAQRGKYAISGTYPLAQVRGLEAQLQQSLLDDRDGTLATTLAGAESYLTRYPGAEVETLRILMVKAKQISGLEQRSEIIHDICIKLENATFDADEARIYKNLLEGLEAFKQPTIDIPLGIKEILLSLKLVNKENHNLKLSVIELSGRRDLNALDFTYNERDLVLLEKSGEVYFRGAILKDLMGRQTLRKLLNLLIEVYPSFVSKQNLALGLWAESYSPLTHDTRIYTSIKRIREVFGELDIIQSWSGGYRWNPNFSFAIVRDTEVPTGGFLRIEALLVSAFQQFRNQGKAEVARSDLVDLVDSSEATVKRALANLVDRQLLERSGKGRSVTYRLAL